jgi:hypothetical protein
MERLNNDGIIAKKKKRPSDYFDMIGETSTGG